MRIISILIVEDESVIRDGVRRMVEEFFERRGAHNYEIQEASNGRDAYRKCASGLVDVLITDIKMRAMSGISLVRKLASDHVPLHVLAISGYQDYEYVREMMKLGAQDYLIKPIDKAQLFHSLELFVNDLKPRRASSLSTLDLEQRLIEHILLNTSSPQPELDTFLFQQRLDRSMLVRVLFIADGAAQDDPPFALYQLIREHCALHGDLAIQGELSQVWVAILIRNAPGDPHATELAARLNARGHSVLHCSDSVPLALAHTPLARYRRAFYDLPAEQCGGDPDMYLAEIEACLLDAEDTNALTNALCQLFALYQLQESPVHTIKRDIAALSYRLMGKSPDLIEFISKAKFTRHDLMECFEDVRLLSELRARIQEALLYLLEQLSIRRENQVDDLLATVKAHIFANYAADLQLNQLAELVHLHPNYFSSLFRQKQGVTFREYLRKVRIDAAIELIREGRLPIGAIAERVGYGDTAHFFRAFKAVTGTTPKRYKSLQRSVGVD